MEAEERSPKRQKLSQNSPIISDQPLFEKQPPEPDTTRPDDDTPRPASAPLSKNQQKKLRRQQEWEANRDQRKAIRKEKDKVKKERKREARREAAAVKAGDDPGTGTTENDGVHVAQSTEAGVDQDRAHSRAAGRSTQLPITFIYDCSWDELMMDKEITSLTSQLTRCYSDNHRARYRAHLAVTSFGGRMKERFTTTLSRQYESWKGIRFEDEDFATIARNAKTWMSPENKGGFLQAQFGKHAGKEQEVQEQGEVVYLSSDSGETLTELKPYSVYIIGGLVDKNRHKGICHKKACDQGIKTAKLPIGEYMQMASRYVLTVNHVNEIMLRWLEYGDWAQAFDAVIPKRKGGVLKERDERKDSDKEDIIVDENQDGCVEGNKNDKDNEITNDESKTTLISNDAVKADGRDPGERKVNGDANS